MQPRQMRDTERPLWPSWAYCILKIYSDSRATIYSVVVSRLMRTSAIVQDAVLLASLEGVKTGNPPNRGLRGIWYADNWEDAEDFQPYIYVDVSNEMDQWRAAVTKYEFVGGSISSFKYLDY